MDRDYDLFEIVDGTPIWRGHAIGLEDARIKLLEIGNRTANECDAIYLPTREVAARVNVHTDDGRKPVVIQITYNEQLAAGRSGVLRLHGYEVMSIVGNEAAKLLLGPKRTCNLFIVGHGAPDGARREIAEWLRVSYPGVPILALNPASAPRLAGADLNLNEDRPEVWLPLIDDAVKSRGAKSAGFRP